MGSYEEELEDYSEYLETEIREALDALKRGQSGEATKVLERAVGNFATEPEEGLTLPPEDGEEADNADHS